VSRIPEGFAGKGGGMSAKRRAKACPDLSGSDGRGPEVVDEADGLTGPQAKAIAALLQEPTMQRVADAAGVNVRTLQRWMKDEGFRRAWLAARREAYGQAVSLTQRLAPAAVATFAQVMKDPQAPAAAKVSAASALLRFGREGIELEDFAERLEALERKAAGEVTQAQGKEPERPPMRLVKDEAEPESAREPNDDRDDRDGVGPEDVT
jgi:hypothetical protein